MAQTGLHALPNRNRTLLEFVDKIALAGSCDTHYEYHVMLTEILDLGSVGHFELVSTMTWPAKVLHSM